MQFYQHVTIKDWLVEDRPREKMIHRGVMAMTDAELIGILLGSGHQSTSAVDLGRELIQVFGGIPQVAKADIEALTKVKGVGKAKATQIVSAFELGRRKSLMEHSRKFFDNAAQVGRYLIPKIGELEQEGFYVLFLNLRNQILGEKLLFLGGTTRTLVDDRLIFRKAVSFDASRIIIAHNHPSGVVSPSQADLDITQRIYQRGKYLGIELFDHLIITGTDWFSFRETNLMDAMAQGKSLDINRL